MSEVTLKADRSWGWEHLLYVVPSKFTIKLLEVKAGKRGGLQKHWFKHEFGIILRGRMLVKTGSEPSLLQESYVGKGDVIVFPPGMIHQEIAIQDTTILEVSTPHFNDRVRFDYESNMENKLLSTTPSDVLEITSPTLISQLESLGFHQTSIDLPRILNGYFP